MSAEGIVIPAFWAGVLCVIVIEMALILFYGLFGTKKRGNK